MGKFHVSQSAQPHLHFARGQVSCRNIIGGTWRQVRTQNFIWLHIGVLHFTLLLPLLQASGPASQRIIGLILASALFPHLVYASGTQPGRTAPATLIFGSLWHGRIGGRSRQTRRSHRASFCLTPISFLPAIGILTASPPNRDPAKIKGGPTPSLLTRVVPVNLQVPTIPHRRPMPDTFPYR